MLEALADDVAEALRRMSSTGGEECSGSVSRGGGSGRRAGAEGQQRRIPFPPSCLALSELVMLNSRVFLASVVAALMASWPPRMDSMAAAGRLPRREAAGGREPKGNRRAAAAAS